MPNYELDDGTILEVEDGLDGEEAVAAFQNKDTSKFDFQPGWLGAASTQFRDTVRDKIKDAYGNLVNLDLATAMGVPEDDPMHAVLSTMKPGDYYKGSREFMLDLLPITGDARAIEAAAQAEEEGDWFNQAVNETAVMLPIGAGIVGKAFGKGKDIAEGLLAKGVPEEEIYKQTGMWKAGKDWRQHYPNKKFQETKFEVKAPSPLADMDAIGELDPAQVLNSLPEYSATMGLEPSDFAGGIVLKPAMGDGIRGSYNAAEQKLTLYVRPNQHMGLEVMENPVMDVEHFQQEMSTLIHELTHAGQKKVGLPTGGGSPSYEFFHKRGWHGKKLQAKKTIIEQRVMPNIQKRMDTLKELYEEYAKTNDPDRIKSIARKYNNLANQKRYLTGLMNRPGIRTSQDMQEYTYLFYRNLLGEQDARLSQSALDWGDEGLKNVFPKGTTEYDVVLGQTGNKGKGYIDRPVYDDFEDKFVEHGTPLVPKMSFKKTINDVNMLIENAMADNL